LPPGRDSTKVAVTRSNVVFFCPGALLFGGVEMAEGKKSFIAYVDWRETFEALPDEKAGQLVKHLFAYVSDENPVSPDVLINAVFANIKQQLKRDLKRWEDISLQRADIGRLGGIKSGEARRSKPKQTKQVLSSRSKPKQNEHDTVNVNDTVNDIMKKVKYSEFVSMLPEEKEKLITEHGEKNTNIFIEILNNYKGSSGKKYKSDYLTILNWVIDDAKKKGKYIGVVRNVMP
jgi:hypothetical protein